MVSITGSTTAAQIRDFERQMQSVAREKIPRGVQFALNGVAKVPLVELAAPVRLFTRKS